MPVRGLRRASREGVPVEMVEGEAVELGAEGDEGALWGEKGFVVAVEAELA